NRLGSRISPLRGNESVSYEPPVSIMETEIGCVNQIALTENVVDALSARIGRSKALRRSFVLTRSQRDRHPEPMSSNSFITVSAILVALAPGRVSDVQTDSKAMPANKPPRVIYVRQFSVPQTTQTEDQQSGRPRILGRLRGAEDQTLIGQHKEEQKEQVIAN